MYRKSGIGKTINTFYETHFGLVGNIIGKSLTCPKNIVNTANYTVESEV